jgi:hypothetical protein
MINFVGFFVVLYGLFRWIRTKAPGRDYFTWSITLLMILCTCYFGVDLSQQYLTLVSAFFFDPDRAWPNHPFLCEQLPDVANGMVAYKLNLVASVLYSLIDFVSQMVLVRPAV